jgi:uncharacterized protein (TIGR03905 family)
MTYSYRTQGVCSQKITFSLENGIVSDVTFYGGCNGNLKGIAKLVDGMKAEDVIARIKGTTCGFKRTSCPDQLAKALEEALKEG